MSDVTNILARAQGGDPTAADELLPLVYGELRQLAAAKMAREASAHTLQPTALVHEAWLRLAGDGQAAPWNGRAHFFGAAAEAMRRILIESARRRRAERHGGNLQRTAFDGVEVPAPHNDESVLAIDEALERFVKIDPKAAELVKLRCFVGMTMPEAAEALDLPLRSAERLWTFSRAWLQREISARLD